MAKTTSDHNALTIAEELPMACFCSRTEDHTIGEEELDFFDEKEPEDA